MPATRNTHFANVTETTCASVKGTEPTPSITHPIGRRAGSSERLEPRLEDHPFRLVARLLDRPPEMLPRLPLPSREQVQVGRGRLQEHVLLQAAPVAQPVELPQRGIRAFDPAQGDRAVERDDRRGSQ